MSRHQIGVGIADPTPMRVLKVTQSYYPFLERGGPTVKVRAIARGLTQRGHLITVLTSDLGLEQIADGTDAAVRGPWGWQSRRDSVETLYLQSWAHYRSLTWNPGVFGFCRERLASFEIVHIYGLYDLLGPIVARACRRIGVPYVIEPMGMFRPIVRNIWLKKVYRTCLGGAMVRNARRVVVTSPQEQAELVEEDVPKAKIILRRNGIELPEQLPALGVFRRRWCISEDVTVVLFLGRLVSKKSPELLLEAFARWKSLSGANRKAILVLAGPDEGDGYREQLEVHAARLHLDKTTLFTGALYDDAKWSAFRDADLFVLSSQNENFGNTAAEAVACGTPVLVTDRCGVAPLVAGRAGIVVPHERDALATALADLLDNGKLRQRLKEGCAEVVRELDWAEPLAETEMLYANVVNETKRR